jgi:hypothetical protein
MGKLHFWLGIGASQAGAESTEGKSADRQYPIISIVIGILIPILVIVVLFMLTIE